ncbi:MAG: hypothetical protein WC890_06855 [Candidatus Margulisiibacteriota bacterium]
MSKRAAQQIRRQIGLDRSLAEITEWHRNCNLKPGVLEAARQIMRGRMPREACVECEDGYRITHPQLIEMVRQDLVSDAERITAKQAMATDLVLLGFRVMLIMYDPKRYEHLDPHLLEKAKATGIKDEDLVLLEAEKDDEMPCSLAFPRDLFVQLDDRIYINPECGGPINWKNLFQRASWLKRDYSRIGFGGEVIIGDTFALLAEQYVPRLTGMSFREREQLKMQLAMFRSVTIGETEGTLSRKGYQVYTLPCGWMELFPPSILAELNTEKKFYVPSDHVDMQAAFLPEERAILLNEPYYRDNKPLMDHILDGIKPSLFKTLPPEEGLPINLLPLPGGGVFLDKASVQSAEILRQAGIKVETTTRPFGTWAWGTWGGIHCSTNMLWLPK